MKPGMPQAVTTYHSREADAAPFSTPPCYYYYDAERRYGARRAPRSLRWQHDCRFLLLARRNYHHAHLLPLFIGSLPSRRRWAPARKSTPRAIITMLHVQMVTMKQGDTSSFFYGLLLAPALSTRQPPAASLMPAAAHHHHRSHAILYYFLSLNARMMSPVFLPISASQDNSHAIATKTTSCHGRLATMPF